MILGRTGFARKGEWTAAVTYDALDIVTHEGKVYIGRRESVGSEPSSESNDWVMLPGAPSFEIEETVSGYDLTITGSDGTSETISILNGEVDREELEDALEAFRSSTDAYFASDYDDTATYSAGDSCIYDGHLYRCIEDIPTAEPWTAEHWESVVLSNKVAQMRKDAVVKADVVVSSAEPGDVVSFDDGADNVPVKELVVSVEPIQDGEPWIDSEYDKVPYTFRPVSNASVSRIGNREMDKLIGGTVAWNQLFPYRTTTFSGTGWNLKGNGDGTLTITVTDTTATSTTATNPTALSDGVMTLNHKYLWLSGNSLIRVDIKSMAIYTDTIFNCTNAGYSNIAIIFTDLPQGTYTIKPMLIDLTQMFGSTIADYIYSLEQANTGDGVAWFKRLFPKDYYPYNSGELMSVQTSAHVMRDANDNVIGNYPLDSDLVLRGIPKLDANNDLYYDGDTYESNGTVTRKYGIVDLGTLTWTYVASDTVFYASISDKRDGLATVRCGSRYMPGGLSGYSTSDYLIGQSSNASLLKRIFISDPNYNTASAFKASLNGVMLVYELATPTTETADPFAQYQIVDADGTEEYVDERTVPIPVGHESNYAYYSPISGWTGVEVYQSKGNIWNEQWELGTIDNSGQKQPSNNAFRSKNYMDVYPKQKLYVYVGANKFIYMKLYTADGTFVSGVNARNQEITIPNNASIAKMLFSVGSEYGATYLNDISINYPSTITTYNAMTTVPILWQSTAGTVYGGSLDLTTGVLSVDRIIDSITKDSAWYGFSTGTGNASAVVQLSDYSNVVYVDGSSSRNGAISSTGKEAQNYWINARQNEVPGDGDMCFAYSSTGQLRFHRTDITNITDLASFKANFPDTQICYQLKNPVTYQLTPTQIRSLFGVNTFWSNSNGGIQSLRYVSDLKLYLEQLTKPTEDDMIANSNIPANTYFNVGNALYLSTAAIAAGEKIEPDTNCTRKSLADALNDLHD